MKIKILLAIAATLLFGLGVVVYGVGSTSTLAGNACCCKGDNCPTKSKDAKAGDKMTMADGCDCSKGENCPMKSGDKAAGTDAKMGDGENCPMMKKDGSNMSMGSHPDMKMGNGMRMGDGESCPMMKGGDGHKMSMDSKMGGDHGKMMKDGGCGNCKHAKAKKDPSAI